MNKDEDEGATCLLLHVGRVRDGARCGDLSRRASKVGGGSLSAENLAGSRGRPEASATILYDAISEHRKGDEDDALHLV